MDKRVIFAVAGSGKTTYIINSLCLDKRSLIITYTNNNFLSIKERVINKFGYLPENIKIETYFSFLHSFCFKPFLFSKVKSKGINFNYSAPRFAKKSTPAHYIDRFRRLYSNRLAKLLIAYKQNNNIVKRLEKYFDNIFIDEIQDFGGNDFNLLKELAKSSINNIYVGDYFQHTFDTSRDGRINKSLHEDFEKYKMEFLKMKMTIDETTLKNSYRCSKSICEFIHFNLKINIASFQEIVSAIKLIEEDNEIMSIFNDSSIVKLFYQSHTKYSCFSNNWGASKGEDKYIDIAIVLNPSTFKKFQKGTLHSLSPGTKNKLYVAISRARRNIYFIEETKLNLLL